MPQSQISSESKLLGTPRVSDVRVQITSGDLGRASTHASEDSSTLDLAGAFWALDDEAQVALYRAHTEPLGTWVGVTARTVHLAA